MRPGAVPYCRDPVVLYLSWVATELVTLLLKFPSLETSRFNVSSLSVFLLLLNALYNPPFFLPKNKLLLLRWSCVKVRRCICPYPSVKEKDKTQKETRAMEMIWTGFIVSRVINLPSNFQGRNWGAISKCAVQARARPPVHATLAFQLARNEG